MSTYDELKVGKIYSNAALSDADKKWHCGMSFLVIRIATEEEYDQQCLEHGVLDNKTPWTQKVYFYEIQMD